MESYEYKRQNRRDIFLMFALVIAIVSNFMILFEVRSNNDINKIALVVSNESADSAMKAANQSLLNADTLMNHDKVVVIHANESRVSHNAVLNNTELLYQLLETHDNKTK